MVHTHVITSLKYPYIPVHKNAFLIRHSSSQCVLRFRGFCQNLHMHSHIYISLSLSRCLCPCHSLLCLSLACSHMASHQHRSGTKISVFIGLRHITNTGTSNQTTASSEGPREVWAVEACMQVTREAIHEAIQEVDGGKELRPTPPICLCSCTPLTQVWQHPTCHASATRNQRPLLPRPQAEPHALTCNCWPSLSAYSHLPSRHPRMPGSCPILRTGGPG